MTGINGNSTQEQLSNDSIFLVDSYTSYNELKKIVSDFPKIRIISFDYDAHDNLNNLGIVHSISEEYSDDTIYQLQPKIYEFSNWYKDPNISSLLNFSNLNYGQLFHEEIVDLLVHFLKKFKEIKNIYQKFPNTHFLATSILYDIISSFTEHVTLMTAKNDTVFANDKIRYNIKIGNKHIMLFISRKMYLRLKQLSEYFVNLFFKPSNYTNSKYSLMVEFDTERFKNIFSESLKSNIKILFYGRRRPAIWNFSTFNIFKKTNSKIITERFISTSHMKKNIDSGIIELNSKLDKLWQNDLFFNSFFSIENISFWSSLKPSFQLLLENRVNHTVSEIKLAENLFKKCHISNVMVLSEIGFTEQIIISQAKLNHVPIILLQMGLNFDTREAYSMNYSQSVYPMNADKFVVWGKIYEDDAKNNGNVEPSKILSLGSPRFDNIIFDDKNNFNEYVLLATSGPQREDLRGISTKNIEKYKLTIQKICKIVKSQNKKLVIKLHPSWAELDVSDIAKAVDSTTKIIISGNISDLIKSCSVMICMGLSTAILEAQLLQKPVISISVIDYQWGFPTIFSSNSCIISNTENLNHILNELKNDEFRNNIVTNANKFLHDCLINHKLASSKLLNYLDTL